MKNIVRGYSLPILSGFLIGTSYIPFPPWALFFCVVPLFVFWTKENSLKKIFIGGWLTQFFLNAIGFHWISWTTVEFGRMPWPAGIAVLLLFCTIAHLYYPVAGVLWKILVTRLQIKQSYALLMLPFVFVLCERLYPILFYWHFGYPWLWARLPGYQTAEWIGFFGLSTLTMLINALFALFWLNRKKGHWLNKWSLSAITIFASVNLVGFIISKNISAPDKSLKVLMVQGNIGNLEKVYATKGGRYVEHITNQFMALTEQGLQETPGVDLILWPETAFPETIYEGRLPGRQLRRVMNLSKRYGVPIFTGAYQRKGPKNRIHNGTILIDGDEIKGDYQKTILLAFGEYFPFADTFPVLRDWFPAVSDFGRGKGPSAIPFSKGVIGTQICYEGLFDEFSTGLQKQGAHFFINVTNDSWYPEGFQPYQHMYMTLARAVENRRPLLRVTNTGITTAILHDGTSLEFSPRNQEWYKTYDIPYHSQPPQTFYVNLAENWIWILLLIIGSIIAGDRIARTGKH